MTSKVWGLKGHELNHLVYIGQGVKWWPPCVLATVAGESLRNSNMINYETLKSTLNEPLHKLELNPKSILDPSIISPNSNTTSLRKRNSKHDVVRCFIMYRVARACKGQLWQVYLGCCPLPVTVTTRIVIFLVGDSYKPSFATATGRGATSKVYLTNAWNRSPRILSLCHTGR